MKIPGPGKEPRRPVGIWIRVPTDDQAKGDSPDHHEARARTYALSKDFDVREVYHMEAVSGKFVMAYPETQRMLRDIERGHISGLILSKLAGIACDTKELLDFSDRFREAGADLTSLQENIDTSSPASRLFFTIIAAMAQWEREGIVDRIKWSIKILAQLGKTLGGAVPFGYEWEEKRLVPNPVEAPIHRQPSTL